jgi:hypothetical protein
MVRNERDEGVKTPCRRVTLADVVPSLQIELGASGGVTLI